MSLKGPIRKFLTHFLVFSPVALMICDESWAKDLICEIKRNGESYSRSRVPSPAGVFVQYGEVDGFRLKIRALGASSFELEVVDLETPARSYSSGALEKSSHVLTWTLWRRDILLETDCRLATVPNE